MNISGIEVKLIGNDILSIINEFVQIDGLTLENVYIEDGIVLEGNFKKGFRIDFHIKVEIVEYVDNKIVARITKAKVLNIGVFRIFRSLALKQLSKVFADKGINSDKDKVIINVNKLLQDVPFVDLNIEEIFIKGSEVYVEVNKVNISIAGKLVKKLEVEEVTDELKTVEEKIDELGAVNKVNDSYSKGRKILEDKLPNKAQKYKDYIFVLPDIVSLIYRLLKDKRVPIKTKLLISATIAYITVPTDIIPDNIPFIGRIDDVGVLFFTLNKILKDVPLAIIIENWQGKNEILIVLKKGIEYLINFTGAQNVEALYSVVEELSTL